MLELNKQSKFSSNFLKYIELKTFLLCLLISPITLGFSLFFWVAIAIYLAIDNSNTSFIFDRNQITLNFGIFVKNNKQLFLKNIQNTRLVKGPLMRMMGVVRVELWSSSLSQIHQNDRGVEIRPDMTLYLGNSEADFLKKFITDVAASENMLVK